MSETSIFGDEKSLLFLTAGFSYSSKPTPQSGVKDVYESPLLLLAK